MKRIKFDCYTDGVLNVGIIESDYSSMERNFISNNFFYFSKSNLREEDKYKFDGEMKASLKVKIRSNNLVKPNQVVKINDEIFNIEKIDKGKTSDFLYLSNYKEFFNKVIEFYSIIKVSSLQDPELKLYKKEFANVEIISNKETTSSGSVRPIRKLKITVIADNILTNTEATTKYKFKLADKLYNITSIFYKDEFLEIEGVEE